MTPVNAQQLAGIYMSVPFFISTLLTPIFGHLSDIYNYKSKILKVCPVIGLVAISLLFLKITQPLIPLVVLGFGTAAYSTTFWPIIP